MILTEGDLRFDFTGSLTVLKFDNPTSHGCSTFKAVDFIVEYQDKIYFIEVKDPENRAITTDRRGRERKIMKYNMSDDSYIHELGQKCRDTYMYRFLQNINQTKNLHYIVLVAFEHRNASALATMSKNLKYHTGFEGPHRRGWALNYLHQVAAVDLKMWPIVVPEVKVSRV